MLGRWRGTVHHSSLRMHSVGPYFKVSVLPLEIQPAPSSCWLCWRSPSGIAGTAQRNPIHISHPIHLGMWSCLCEMSLSLWSVQASLNSPAAVSVPKITASSSAFCDCAILIKTNSNLQTAVVGAYQFCEKEWTNTFSKWSLLQVSNRSLTQFCCCGNIHDVMGAVMSLRNNHRLEKTAGKRK